MTAETILQGIIPIDRELTRLCTKIIQEEPLPSNLKNGLKRAITTHGVYLFRYSQDPREHDKALNSVMASGNDMLAVLAACMPEGQDAFISWDNRRELERILVARAKWGVEYEERRRNSAVIFMGDGKTRAN